MFVSIHQRLVNIDHTWTGVGGIWAQSATEDEHSAATKGPDCEADPLQTDTANAELPEVGTGCERGGPELWPAVRETFSVLHASAS